MTTEKSGPLSQLMEDHVVVLMKLKEMEVAMGKLPNRESVSVLKDIAGFLMGEVVVHFAKEEEALFPEMEKFIPGDGGPIGAMLIEHNNLNELKANFVRAVEQLSKDAGSEDSVGLIIENGKRFIMLLRDHIYKEDNILFKMAAMHLDKGQIETVAKLFAELDIEYMAGGN